MIIWATDNVEDVEVETKMNDDNYSIDCVDNDDANEYEN